MIAARRKFAPFVFAAMLNEKKQKLSG